MYYYRPLTLTIGKHHKELKVKLDGEDLE